MKLLKAIISLKWKLVLSMALYNPTVHLLAVLWKERFFPGDRECLHPYKELNHNISVLPFSPSPSTTASTQTNALKRTFNKIYHFSPGFYLHSHVFCFVHSDQFLFLPRGITWSTWSYKTFRDCLHAPNHPACIMQGSKWCSSQVSFLSALCTAPILPLFPRTQSFSCIQDFLPNK